MDEYTLASFLGDCAERAERGATPSDIVAEIAPAMRRLLLGGRSFLRPQHLRSDPTRYCRNLVHGKAEDDISLFTIVWEPGQWTPVHDHGTWGVVGVLEGVLSEQSYMRLDANPREERDHGISLTRGGLVLLSPGAVSTFVPNPDHIHVTGVRPEEPRAVSLHLYGRMLSSFHVYDLDAGTRALYDAPHNES